MKHIKSRFFFFCFLFIFCSINANATQVKSCLTRHQQGDYAISYKERDNRKQQFDQLEYLLHSCFRSNEAATFCFQNIKNVHLRWIAPEGTAHHFSAQAYSSYTAKHLQRFNDFPRYLYHLRLLI